MALALGACAWAAPAVARVRTFEGLVRYSGGEAGKPLPVDYYFKGHRLRMVVRAGRGAGTATLVDLRAHEMTVLVPQMRRYMVVRMPEASGGAAAGDWAPTGKTSVLLGYACRQYRYSGPSGRADIWATRALGAFPGFPTTGASAAAAGLERAFQERGLFPLKVTLWSPAGKELSRLEAVRVEARRLPDSLFEPPAGYSAMGMPGAAAGGMP